MEKTQIKQNLADELAFDLTIDYANEVIYYSDRLKAFLDNDISVLSHRIRSMIDQIEYLLPFDMVNSPHRREFSHPIDVGDTLVQYWFPHQLRRTDIDNPIVEVERHGELYSIYFPCLSDYQPENRVGNDCANSNGV